MSTTMACCMPTTVVNTTTTEKREEFARFLAECVMMAKEGGGTILPQMMTPAMFTPNSAATTAPTTVATSTEATEAATKQLFEYILNLRPPVCGHCKTADAFIDDCESLATLQVSEEEGAIVVICMNCCVTATDTNTTKNADDGDRGKEVVGEMLSSPPDLFPWPLVVLALEEYEAIEETKKEKKKTSPQNDAKNIANAAKVATAAVAVTATGGGVAVGLVGGGASATTAAAAAAAAGGGGAASPPVLLFAAGAASSGTAGGMGIVAAAAIGSVVGIGVTLAVVAGVMVYRKHQEKKEKEAQKLLAENEAQLVVTDDGTPTKAATAAADAFIHEINTHWDAMMKGAHPTDGGDNDDGGVLIVTSNTSPEERQLPTAPPTAANADNAYQKADALSLTTLAALKALHNEGNQRPAFLRLSIDDDETNSTGGARPFLHPFSKGEVVFGVELDRVLSGAGSREGPPVVLRLHTRNECLLLSSEGRRRCVCCPADNPNANLVVFKKQCVTPDVLFMGTAAIFNQLWSEHKVTYWFNGIAYPIKVRTFGVLSSVCKQYGFIEYIPGLTPMTKLKDRSWFGEGREGAGAPVLSDMVTARIGKGPARNDLQFQATLFASAIASFITSYVLGVRDRHQDNVCLAPNSLGKPEVVQIDFTFIFEQAVNCGLDRTTFPFPAMLFNMLTHNQSGRGADMEAFYSHWVMAFTPIVCDHVSLSKKILSLAADLEYPFAHTFMATERFHAVIARHVDTEAVRRLVHKALWASLWKHVMFTMGRLGSGNSMLPKKASDLLAQMIVA